MDGEVPGIEGNDDEKGRVGGSWRLCEVPMGDKETKYGLNDRLIDTERQRTNTVIC